MLGNSAVALETLCSKDSSGALQRHAPRYVKVDRHGLLVIFKRHRSSRPAHAEVQVAGVTWEAGWRRRNRGEGGSVCSLGNSHFLSIEPQHLRSKRCLPACFGLRMKPSDKVRGMRPIGALPAFSDEGEKGGSKHTCQPVAKQAFNNQHVSCLHRCSAADDQIMPSNGRCLDHPYQKLKSSHSHLLVIFYRFVLLITAMNLIQISHLRPICCVCRTLCTVHQYRRPL